jgi:hypothetical protein
MQEFQKEEGKRITKMQGEKKTEIAKLQQQNSAAIKQRDQQIKALYDSKVILQKQLEQTTTDLGNMTTQYLDACKHFSIADWIRELENNSNDVVRSLYPLQNLLCEHQHLDDVYITCIMQRAFHLIWQRQHAG